MYTFTDPRSPGGVTPLHYSVWELALQGHSDAEFVHYVCAGLRFGFRVGFDHHCTLRSANSNMMPAIQHPEPIAEYIEKELQRSRMLGPFPVGGRQQSAIQISRFGVIPKGNKTRANGDS